MKLDKSAVKRCRDFLLEREALRIKKENGEPKPWTKDPILQQYKFCCVRREDDRVTHWVRINIRERFWDHADLWWMLCAARQINWPDTLEELMSAGKGAWPVQSGKWNPERMRDVLRARAARGDKVYTGAYMISGQGQKGTDKPTITALLTLAPLWELRKHFSSRMCGITLAEAAALFKGCQGFGTFLTGQVIADLKHTRYLESAEDFWDWAVLGPGSTRGLNRLHGRHDPARPHPYNLPWHSDLIIPALQQLRTALDLPWKLCLQDIQNSACCEFDKYERTRLGEGRPRSTYPGRT